MMVYLAADVPLTLILWDEAAPGFYVSELAADETTVCAQFTKKHVVYVGSHEGCGCGFQYAKWPDASHEPEELASGHASKRALAEFLEREVERVGPVELYACWDGDQAAVPQHNRTLRPRDVAATGFFFLEKEKSLVSCPPLNTG